MDVVPNSDQNWHDELDDQKWTSVVFDDYHHYHMLIINGDDDDDDDQRRPKLCFSAPGPSWIDYGWKHRFLGAFRKPKGQTAGRFKVAPNRSWLTWVNWLSHGSIGLVLYGAGLLARISELAVTFNVKWFHVFIHENWPKEMKKWAEIKRRQSSCWGGSFGQIAWWFCIQTKRNNNGKHLKTQDLDGILYIDGSLRGSLLNFPSEGICFCELPIITMGEPLMKCLLCCACIH